MSELDSASEAAIQAAIGGPDEHCPSSKDGAGIHCACWYECEACHWCGDDTPDPMCDCDRCADAHDEPQPTERQGDER